MGAGLGRGTVLGTGSVLGILKVTWPGMREQNLETKGVAVFSPEFLAGSRGQRWSRGAARAQGGSSRPVARETHCRSEAARTSN